MTPLGRQTAPSDQASAQVTIVGLGLIGTALGLALKASGTLNLRIVGHDKEPDASSFALKARAVDRTEWHLIRAVEKADLVVLAVPLAAMRGLFEAIGPVLKPGCVVMYAFVLLTAQKSCTFVASPSAHWHSGQASA